MPQSYRGYFFRFLALAYLGFERARVFFGILRSARGLALGSASAAGGAAVFCFLAPPSPLLSSLRLPPMGIGASPLLAADLAPRAIAFWLGSTTPPPPSFSASAANISARSCARRFWRDMPAYLSRLGFLASSAPSSPRLPFLPFLSFLASAASSALAPPAMRGAASLAAVRSFHGRKGKER